MVTVYDYVVSNMEKHDDGTFFTECRGIVLCCIFHPSQLLLISGGDDSQIKIWDLISKTCVATLQAHFSAVTSLSISNDGWTLLSGGRDGVVVLWNLKDYSKVATIPVYEAIECVAVLPNDMIPATDGIVFATGGEKGVVKCWRSDTAKCISEDLPSMPKASTAGSIVELCITSPGHSFSIAAATQDCRILLLELEQSKIGLYRQFIGNNDEVTDLRFVTGSDRLAVATNGEHIHIFDTNTLGCLDTLSGHKEAVLALDYLENHQGRKLLASGSKDTTVRLWDLTESGKALCLAMGTGHVSAVTAIAFCRKRDSNFLISGGADKLLRVWDMSNIGDSKGPITLPAISAIPAHEKDINAVCVAPNDQFVASGSQDKTIKVWKLPDLTPVHVFRGHKRGIWSVAFSPVDQALVSASGDKTIKLWNLKDGSCLRTFEGHVSSVLRVNFLSAGAQIMSSGADGLMKLWNIRTAEAIATFDAHEDKVWALALGSDHGDIAASGGSDGSIAIWRDCTEADRANAAKEAEAIAIQEQELENAVFDGEWKQAASLAIDMGRPGQLLNVVKKATNFSKDSGDSILVEVVKSLDSDQLKKTLEYCREWNAHSKNCSSAQVMLHAIFSVNSKQDLLSIHGFDGILEGIEAYTNRHRSRVDRLIRSSYILDYILGVMGALTPVMNDDTSNENRKDDLIITPEDDPVRDKTKKEKRSKRKRKNVQ